MLAKKYKIKGNYRIQKALKKGKKLPFSNFFTTYYLIKRGYGENYAHFSVIIPKRLKLKAVKRNRCKRRVYAALEKLPALTKKENCDIVIIVKNPLEKISLEKIQQELNNILLKL